MIRQILNSAAGKARRIFGLGILALVSTAIGFTSCSNDDDPRPGDGKKIAAILKADNAYWQQVARGIEAEAKAQGLTTDIFYASADVDPQGQLATLRSLDLTQYKGLVIVPSAPAQMSADIEAVAAQLPVAIIDTPLGTSDGGASAVRSFLGTNNHAAGKAYAQYLAANLWKTVGPPAPKTCLIIQLKNSPAIAQRIEGFKQGLPTEITPKEVVVDDNTATAITQIKAAIKSTEGIKLYFAANGTTANWLLTASQTISLQGMITAFDVTSPLLKGLKDGTVAEICA